MPTDSKLAKVFDLVIKFVSAQKGCWQHDDWETFLQKAEKAGVEITDESKRCLGNLLESAKFFYEDSKPALKKAAAKPAAKTVSKPKAKAKTKAK